VAALSEKELGATHAINCKQTNSVEAIRDITGGGVNYYLAFFRARRGQSEALGAALGALVEPTRLGAGCLTLPSMVVRMELRHLCCLAADAVCHHPTSHVLLSMHSVIEKLSGAP
jgi:Zn-dependent alcohol dehydrogenase